MPINIVREFIKLESKSSFFLLLAALSAMVIANSPFSELYNSVLNYSFGFILFDASETTSLKVIVNEGLMTLFFLLISLELKREFLIGELRTLQKALLPLMASIGGMAMAALTFLLINHGIEINQPGWGVPTATDVAFSSAALVLLGKSIPNSLKIFLIALAITDDLGSIFIISIFYTHQPVMIFLVIAVLCYLLLVMFNLSGVTNTTLYILFGVVLWMCVLKSNINPPLAGVLIGSTIPLKSAKNANVFPLQALESLLHPWVVFGILPVFAFVNGGLTFSGMHFSSLFNPLTLGILLGLFVGKQLGIFSTCFVAVKLRLAHLPSHTNWKLMYGMSVLCGIGFTMNLFIGFLAYPQNPDYLNMVKLGVFSGSVISAVSGYLILKMSVSRN